MKIIQERITSSDEIVYDISLGKMEMSLLLSMSEKLYRELPKHIELHATRGRLRNFIKAFGPIIHSKKTHK